MKKVTSHFQRPAVRSLNATLIGISFFESASHRIASLRRNEPAELIILFDGVYTAELPVRRGGATLRAKAGDVVFWPAGAERLEVNDPLHPTRCIALYFKWRPPTDLPHLAQDTALVLRLLGQRLISLKQQSRKFPVAVGNAYLNAILAEYIRLAEVANSPMVNRVLDYVEHHLADPMTVAHLAAAAGLERHHFGRQFKKEKGVTPMDYVRRHRVEYALGMLATSATWTVKKIARRVGIPNEIRLRQWLKRYTGINLRDLKKMARQHSHHPDTWPISLLEKPPAKP